MSANPRWSPTGKLFHRATDQSHITSRLSQSVGAASDFDVTNYPNLWTDASIDSIYDTEINFNANENGYFLESFHNVSPPAPDSSIAAYARPYCSNFFDSSSFAPSSNDCGPGIDVGMPHPIVREPTRCLPTTHVSIRDIGDVGTIYIGAELAPVMPSTWDSHLHPPAELSTFSKTYNGSCQSNGNDPMNLQTWNASSSEPSGWGPSVNGNQPQPSHPNLEAVSCFGLAPSMYSEELAPPSSQWACSPLEGYNMNLTMTSSSYHQMPQPPIEPLRAPDMLIGEQDRNGVPIPGALWQDIFKCYWHDGRCGAALYRKSCASYKDFLKSIFSHLGAHVGNKDEQFHCRWQGCRFECNAEKVKNERDRIRHVLTHLGPRWRYLCVRCGKTYSRKDTRTQRHTCHPKSGIPSPEACNGMSLAYFWAYYGDRTSSP